MCSQAETRVKCHCRIQMKNYQRIKWNPSKHNVLQFVVFYSNSETFGFHLQPGPKQRQTCMLHFRHSFLALLFFNFFFLSQFLKWIQKKKKKSPLLFLIWAICPLPAGSAPKRLPIFRPCSLTSRITRPDHFTSSIFLLSPKPEPGQEDLCKKDTPAFFPKRKIHLVPILSFLLCPPLVNCLKE